MNTDYFFLNPAPMPYLTDCDYKCELFKEVTLKEFKSH